MPSDWQRIRAKRSDVTDWVVHWTRWRNADGAHETAFQVLQRILRCGYLKPTFGPRSRATIAGDSNTIKGPYPAVCFTDQPLSAFVQSCSALSSRYFPYGVAFEKRHLFKYGGRPVAYGDREFLDFLEADWKFLWVRYDPIPDPAFGNYPIDWTHEREWRARVVSRYFGDVLTSEEGIPLVLPPVYSQREWLISLPRILVRTSREAVQLRDWLGCLPKYDGPDKSMRYLYEHFSELAIIPLDLVQERLAAGDARWARLETLPFDEIPPSHYQEEGGNRSEENLSQGESASKVKVRRALPF